MLLRGEGGRAGGVRGVGGWIEDESGAMALRDIRVGGVFIFIRFYGLEKHCHAYQLAAEQMARCGRMFRHMHKSAYCKAAAAAAASGRSTGGESSC